MDTDKDLQFIRAPKVMELTGLPISSLYQLIAKGHFPRPIKLSSRRSGWIKGDVTAWCEDRISDAKRACLTAATRKSAARNRR